MKKVIYWIKRHQDFSAISTLFLISVIFFIRLFIPYPKIFATAEIGINDIWYLNFPLKNFLSESLKKGELPVWDPYRNNGFPAIAEGQIGAFNLYNLIAFRFIPAIDAFNLGLIVMFFICSLGMYLFTRRRGLSPLISVYTGFIYAYSGFFITHISHYVLLQTVTFFPLLLYASELLLEKTTLFRIFFFAFIFSQQIFSGFPQMTFISLVGIGLYMVLLWYQKKTKMRYIMGIMLAIGFGLVLSAAQLLPTLELIPKSNRSSGLSTTEVLYYKYPFEHLISFVHPFYFGNPQKGTYPHFNQFKGSLFWENTGYLGIIPLLMFGIGIVRTFKKLETRFYFGLMLVSFLLMLGGAGPLYFILQYPPFSFFRFPSRFLQLFLWGLVMLSAYGFQYIIARKWKIRQILILIILIISAADISHIWFNYHPTVPFVKYIEEPQIVKYIKEQSHGNVYSFLQYARVFIEFFETGSSRPDRYLDLKNDLGNNLNNLYKISSSNAYASSLTPKRLAHYNNLVGSLYSIATPSTIIDVKVDRLISIRNTTHIISPIPLLNSSYELTNKFTLPTLEKHSNVYLYKNLQAVPKYYFVNKATYVDTLEELVEKLSIKEFDIQKEALVENPNLVQKSTDELITTINLISESTKRIDLEITSNQPAILISTNSFYPNWKAYLNSKTTEIFPINFINQGVKIPAGKHSISFRYEASTVIKGILISSIGYVALIISTLFIILKKTYIGIHIKT